MPPSPSPPLPPLPPLPLSPSPLPHGSELWDPIRVRVIAIGLAGEAVTPTPELKSLLPSPKTLPPNPLSSPPPCPLFL
eukprot:scaffold61219_cov63-Phaeocystis_antarctica.AAC.1